MSELETERIQRKKRKLSQFLARELTYDYFSGKLSKSDLPAFESCLEQFPEIRRDVEYIRIAQGYCEKLQQTQLSAALVQSLTSSKQLGPRSIKTFWKRTSPALRFGIQAAAIAGFVVGLAPHLPWNWSNLKLPKLETLTEVQKPPAAQLDSDIPPATDGSELLKQASNVESPAKGTNSLESQTNKVATSESKPAIPEVQPKSGETTVAGTMSETPKRHGFVYRGNLIAKEPDVASRALIAYIESHSGKKAGEVDLGWKKREGYYFHFEFPESDYKDLLDEMKNLGRVRIEKFSHTRIMPENVLRIILLVEIPAHPAEQPGTERQDDTYHGDEPATDAVAPAPATEGTSSSPSP